MLEGECRGYILNRLIGTGFSAVAWEYVEGAKPEEIDLAYLGLGSPTGIFEAMDMIGLDVLHSVHRSFVEVYGERFDPPEDFQRELEEMISEENSERKQGRDSTSGRGERQRFQKHHQVMT